MQKLIAINLLGAFDLYLIITFFLGMWQRYRQYSAILEVIFALKQRWPKLVELASRHRTIFLTWQTIVPLVLTFVLMAVNTFAYNFIWTEARVTPEDLYSHWGALIPFVLFGAAMAFLDLTAVFTRWDFDRPALEKNLDQAEYWLRSWVSPALKVLTFGYVNPRAMVSVEVAKSLTAAMKDFNVMFWRWSLQIIVRIAFGTTLWVTWALLGSSTPPAT